jgi:hypothetical protein
MEEEKSSRDIINQRHSCSCRTKARQAAPHGAVCRARGRGTHTRHRRLRRALFACADTVGHATNRSVTRKDYFGTVERQSGTRETTSGEVQKQRRIEKRAETQRAHDGAPRAGDWTGDCSRGVSCNERSISASEPAAIALNSCVRRFEPASDRSAAAAACEQIRDIVRCCIAGSKHSIERTRMRGMIVDLVIKRG